LEKPYNKNKKDVFVILTGSSLNDITEEELEYIKSCPSIATGFYLLYWECFGVIPTHFIFPSPVWNYPALGITSGGAIWAAANIHRYHNFNTTWYVDEETKIYLQGGEIPLCSNNRHYNNENSDELILRRIKKCKYNSNLDITSIDCGEAAYYHNKWATNLDEPFWFNSSIGSAINLASILYPGYNIKLIGNDGGNIEYFYSALPASGRELSMYSKELIQYADQKCTSGHYNIKHFDVPTMLENTTLSAGNAVYNCNYNSMFSDTPTTSEFDEDYPHDEKIPYTPILN
jgi:hypothetical protein